jgi:hypothetical protein
LPPGRDFTAHGPPGGGVVDVVGGGVGGFEVGGAVVGGLVVGGLVGAGVVVGGVPVQAPRSRHSDAASTGFQPAPGGGV